MRAVDRININKMAAAVGRFGESKNIFIQAKFSRINENNKYISQSTRIYSQCKIFVCVLLTSNHMIFSYSLGVNQHS